MESMLFMLMAVLFAGAILLFAHYVMVKLGVDATIRMIILGILGLGILIWFMRYMAVF